MNFRLKDVSPKSYITNGEPNTTIFLKKDSKIWLTILIIFVVLFTTNPQKQQHANIYIENIKTLNEMFNASMIGNKFQFSNYYFFSSIYYEKNPVTIGFLNQAFYLL